ncbi:MAG: inositol monophosphatase family protein [Nitrososphaerales archaeon]
MNSIDPPWETLLAEATRKAQRSVSAVASGGGRGLAVGTGASGDKTLLADLKAEEELSRALFRVKGVKLLSEEAGNIGDPGSRTLAIIDPLDGSSNFERGLPFYCTSVAIAEGRSLRGVRFAMVRNLVNGDVYFAAKGKGASKNGRSISTTKGGMLGKSVLSVDLSGTPGALIAGLVPLLAGSKRVVHYGANALEMCLLAEGKIDAFVDVRGRMRVTDIAGGYLIAREAGAAISLTSEPRSAPEFSLETRFSLVASANRSLHRVIMRCLGSSGGPLGSRSLRPT